MRGVWVVAIGAALSMVALTACHEEYDFERQQIERGTFGEEAFRVLRKDAALSPRSHLERSALLDRDRAQIVLALDTMVPEPFLRPLADFLLTIRHLQDNDLVPGLTRKLAVVFDDVAASGSVRTSWTIDNFEIGRTFKGPDTHAALIEHAVGFPDLKSLTELLVGLVLDNDGFTDTGAPDPGEPAFMSELLRSIGGELQGQTIDGEPDRLGLQLGELLLTYDATFVPSNPGPVTEVVALDGRGKPLVRTDGNGEVFAPFVDNDGDGLADLNFEGRFVDGGNAPLNIAPFGEANAASLVSRDSRGRALAPGGGLLFNYVDLQGTAASYLLQQNTQLVEEDVVFDLPDALQVVLPPRVSLTDPDTGAPYLGYPADQPLMHLFYGLTKILDLATLDELLSASAVLLAEHPDIVAEVLLSLEEFGDLSDAYPEAELEADHTLVDDLAPILTGIAEKPGLIEAILRSNRDPVVEHTEAAALNLISHKGLNAVPRSNGPYNTCFSNCDRNETTGTLSRIRCIESCPNEEILKAPMDFDSPASAQNRSHFERLLAMVHDTDGVAFELFVTRLEIPAIGTDIGLGQDVLPALLVIDNAAEAFFKAVIGEFRLVDHVNEAAIDNEEVHLLLDGFDFICGSSFLGRLIERLIPELVNVSEQQLRSTCGRFEDIGGNNSLGDRDRRRQQLAVLVAFLSLLTDVSMDEVPTAAQLTRFFNSPEPSLDLEILSLSLSELRGRSGDRLWEAHGDMLFAAEATGLLDATVPMTRAFHEHDAIPLMVNLLSALHLHYAAPGVVYNGADGQPLATLGTGVQRYEPLLRDWMTIGRLFPALRAMALANAGIASNRDRPIDTLLEETARHIFAPEPGLTHYDGRTSSVRNDGAPVEGGLSRFYIVADALSTVADRVASNPAAKAKWDRSTDAAVDLFIGVEKAPGGEAVYKNPGSISLSRVMVSHLAKRAEIHRDNGRLRDFVNEDLFGDIESILTGRAMPAVVDLFNTVNSVPAHRDLFKRFLLYSTGDAVGSGYLLIKIYEMLVDLTDEESFVTTARLYGSVLDPDRAWPASAGALPLASHGALILRESLIADEQDVALDIVRFAATRDPQLIDPNGDPRGAYPISALGEVIKRYHRVDPTSTAPLDNEDYAAITGETRDWLLDDRRGMEQLYDLIKARKK